MQLCSRCHKRMAVVFITKFENNEAKNEGLCLKCAKELGIPQVKDILDKMGISDDQLDSIDGEIEALMPMDDGADEAIDDGDESAESRTPPVDFGKLFGGLPFSNPQKSGSDSKKSDGKEKKKNRKYLDMYCRDLTKAAREGKLDSIVGRDRELIRMMQILTRRQKNNPCLIGEPGVGKTAVAEALAQKIAAGDVPYKLRDKEVQLVDLTALVAGTQFRGQFESRMKGLIDEVKALGNIILVIDEVHSIVGVGDAEGSMNAANILKPALSRGEIQLIGATTLNEYRKYIEKDSALERRFQPIIIEEPSVAETKTILEGIKKYYEDYHKIHVSAAMIDRTVELSERYITDRYLPDKAIDLLDEAAAYVAMNSPVIERVEAAERALAELSGQVKALEETDLPTTSDENVLREHYGKIAEIKAKQLKGEKEYEALKDELATIELTPDALAHVIEIWTGIPAGSINANEYERLQGLAGRLKERVIGQDAAVDAVVRAIKRNRAGVSYKRKPASFIFAGPTGVGKTELVKVLANDLFQTPDALIRLDMSEFMEKFSVSRIIGPPPGYVGYDDAGQLTEKIPRKPYSVVLFDEIEKAHPDVLNILLQILDDGRVTDSHGKVVKFEDCIIVMTTNAGSSTGMNLAGFNESSTKAAENRTEKALAEFLRPEFINRVDEIVTFRGLDKDDFVRIAEIMLGDMKKTLAEKSVDFIWTDAAAKYIAEKSFSTKYGARNMRRLISREIEDVAAEKIIDSLDKVKLITADAVGDKLIIEAK
ncbi:MAG: ATP-dependent Clp protease ATP-binding subunit [Clostridiales bacterium]|nr:ATP-dependent Clp protease ATP-binding subunit [Clostridiales bacterium]